MPTRAQTPSGEVVFIYDPDTELSEEEHFALSYVMWHLEKDPQQRKVLFAKHQAALVATRKEFPEITDQDMKTWLANGLKSLADKKIIELAKDGMGAWEPAGFYPGRIYMPDPTSGLVLLDGE